MLNDTRFLGKSPQILPKVRSMLVRKGGILHYRRVVPAPLPDLEPQGKEGKRGPRITRWFVEYRKKMKIYRPGVAMHALR